MPRLYVKIDNKDGGFAYDWGGASSPPVPAWCLVGWEDLETSENPPEDAEEINSI